MKKLYFLTLLMFFLTGLAFGQTGKISGKVIDAGSGQVLVNATLLLIEKTKTELADQNGNFSFARLAPGTYSVRCSYTGYNEKIIEEIIVKDNENTTINISLEVKKALEGVVITTKTSAKKETIASLLVAQKNYAGVSDGISAEAIRKTPDRTTGDAIKRVSGASIQDDRFAIIRGLNDRYNAAFINGAPLPSTESDRKAFAFDIFPAAILDNLIIYKTATPDKTGEFAGGIIDITTKSILPKSFTSVTVGQSYNTLITGKTRFFSENKGNKDWIGIDDGTRGIPAALPPSLAGLTFAERADLAKLFKNYKWGIQQEKAKPNFNFQFSKGFNIEKKGKEFIGALFALNYNRTFSFSTGQRNTYDFDANQAVELVQRGKYTDSVYNEEIVVALLGNISIKLNSKNSLSWKNNLSINTDNRLIKRIGAPDYSADSLFLYNDKVRWYTSNQIFSSQLGGEHLLGSKKTRINWLGSYSKVEREIPNLSRTSYSGSLASGFSAFFPSGQPNPLVGSGTMLFTKTTENIKSGKAELTQPYLFMKNSQNFKAGIGYQVRDRDFTTRLLGLSPYSNSGVPFDFSLLGLPEDQIFLPQHYGKMANGSGGFFLAEGIITNSNYKASSALLHGYLMNEQRFFNKFRLIYGARIERFNQELNTTDNGTAPPIKIDSSVTDILPSVNFVYALTNKINLRLSYAQTVNRPEFRELAPYLFFDYQAQYSISGDIALKRAKIKNYDFRFEFFPGKAQLFSVSAFYKEFKNPIEIVFLPGITNQATYSNAGSAEIYGAEAEFRTLLSTIAGMKKEDGFLSKLTLSANAALIKSKVKLGQVGFFDASRLITDRALQGQSPYLINGSLGYNDEKIGLSATASVNRVGDRIFIAGIKDESADIYEKARTVVDFQLTKLFFKNVLEVKFTAKDILAQRINFYSDFDLSKSFTARDKYFSSFAAPKIFSFSATLKF